MKLTDRTATLAAPNSKPDHIWWDDRVPGFGLRKRGDVSTWLFQYKLAGHTRRMTIGRATAIKAEKALALARGYYQRTKEGGDPANEIAIQKAAAGNTLGLLIARYMDIKKTELRPRSLAEVQRHLEVHAKPLHRYPVNSVSRPIIAGRLNDIAKEAGAVTANRTRASMSAMFTWAIKQGMIESNPTIATPRRKEKSRDRVLSDHELAAIWNALGDDDYGAVIRLLALTGLRASEVGGLQWGEIDFQKSLITLAAERVKNARTHLVPMSDAVRAILEAQPKTEGRDLVFGRGDGPFSVWSRSKAALDEKLGEKIASPWVVHDLRRTCATRMVEIGIAPHVVEAILNHMSGHRAGVAGVYNRANYFSEKKTALDRWAAHVLEVVNGRTCNNVVSMQRPA
jgi:integrase